jgi:hypothetical protein
MYSWNEWLAWLLVEQCTHATHTVVRLQRSRLLFYDNCTATIKDAAGMNGWHGSAYSAMHAAVTLL